MLGPFCDLGAGGADEFGVGIRVPTQHGALEADLGDVGDGGKAKPVVEVAGVEAVAEGYSSVSWSLERAAGGGPCAYGLVPAVRGGLVVEEDARVADEQCGVLEVRAVPGIGVQDELGVGQELLQDVGVDRWDHDVAAAVDD